MTLKKKIFIGYGVAAVFMALVLAWAISNLVSLGRATEAILSENYRSILAAENMVDALERHDSGILLVYLGDSKKGTAQFRENEAVFLEWLARAKDNITVSGEAELLQDMEVGYAAYRYSFSEWTDFGDAGTRVSPVSFYQDVIYPLFSRVRDACIELRRLNEETMYAASVKAGRVADRAIWSTLFVGVAALVAVLAFSLILAGRIVHPIRRFMKAARTISAGDYDVQVPVETKDELGRLAVEFNRMAAQLLRYHRMNIEEIISEKNKGEAILSSIEDGLIVFDTELEVTGINPAARRMLGVETAHFSDLGCSDIFPDSKVCGLIQDTVANGAPPDMADEERIIAFPVGDRPRHYLFSVTAVRGGDHDLSGTVLLLRDVTRLKEVEQLKSEFVMAASHELRTPLTGLGMSVDLLLEHASDALSEKDRELLLTAHQEVHRMKGLVNDLLDLSRIEAGRIEMEFENVRLSTLFEYVESVFKNQFEVKGITFTAVHSDESPTVRVDAGKITWVLTNLISNALRYVDQGGHIRVFATKLGPRVQLAVQDDGPGIPCEYQSRIFEKFIQVKGRGAGGSGLGLAISREIVRAHGGAIWVESLPGEGSTFYFTLPGGLS